MSDKILVLNGPSYRNVVDGLGDVTTKASEFLSDPNAFKMVLFTGGEDVTPMLYGDTSPRGICHNSVERDKFEITVFEKAVNLGIKMTGICRGVQFLNVMSGGRMMHDITNHGGVSHPVVTLLGESLMVNSYHHQLVLPPSDAKVVGWAETNISRSYVGNADLKVDYRGKENEIVIYPRTKSFGVQYHPECMSKDSKGFSYYRNMIIDSLELPWEKFVEVYTIGNNDNKMLTMHKYGSATTG
jgi:anthranilate/para-aminobenzoate synthase component II